MSSDPMGELLKAYRMKEHCTAMKEMAPFHLLPMDSLMLTAWAFKEGEDKHGKKAWIRDDANRVGHVEAALRHIGRWTREESIDADSGCPALAHAIARLMIALYLETNEVGIDDRASIVVPNAE